jgi:hypothetical protein
MQPSWFYNPLKFKGGINWQNESKYNVKSVAGGELTQRPDKRKRNIIRSKKI